MKHRIILASMSFILLASCKSIKPYQRIYVDDEEMQLAKNSAKNFGAYVCSIREGAVPSVGSKSSGGCGCN